MARIIDMHIHSKCSDGEDAIDILFEKIKKAGINYFSLTDHDTIKGCAPMSQLAENAGMRFIPGVEFSCLIDVEDEDSDCHILGYNFDLNSPAIKKIVDKNIEYRQQKMFDLLDYIRDRFGLVISDEAVERLKKIENVGKPMVADELCLAYPEIAEKVAISKNYIFEKYFNDFNSLLHVSAKDAVEAILEAGGTPVWAHPIGDEPETEKHDMGDKFQRQLSSLIEYGIKGLECCYSRYTDEEIAFLISSALVNNLYISGGSDYHGRRKNVELTHTGLMHWQQEEINIYNAFD